MSTKIKIIKESLPIFLEQILVMPQGKYHEFPVEMDINNVNVHLKSIIWNFLNNNNVLIKIRFDKEWFSNNIILKIKNAGTTKYRKRLTQYYYYMIYNKLQGKSPPDYLDEQDAQILLRNINILFGNYQYKFGIKRTTTGGYTVYCINP